MAHIEDRISELNRIVQGMHAVMGHKWYRGDRHGTHAWKECACGVRESLASITEWESLPAQYQLESDF